MELLQKIWKTQNDIDGKDKFFRTIYYGLMLFENRFSVQTNQKINNITYQIGQARLIIRLMKTFKYSIKQISSWQNKQQESSASLSKILKITFKLLFLLSEHLYLIISTFNIANKNTILKIRIVTNVLWTILNVLKIVSLNKKYDFTTICEEKYMLNTYLTSIFNVILGTYVMQKKKIQSPSIGFLGSLTNFLWYIQKLRKIKTIKQFATLFDFLQQHNFLQQYEKNKNGFVK